MADGAQTDIAWSADALSAIGEIPTPPGTPRRPQHPNKAPQVTYLSGVLNANLEAAD